MKTKSMLIFAICLINLTTFWIVMFRREYIFYYHLSSFWVMINIIIFVTVGISLMFKKDIILRLLPLCLSISLYLAVPLFMYPKLVNNPDVIKLIQLTELLASGKYQMARRIEYSSFPGFSYFLLMLHYITGIPIGIKLASIAYVMVSIALLLALVSLCDKLDYQCANFLTIVFLLGFIFSFEYLSPQLFGQVFLFIALFISLKRDIVSQYFLLFLLILAASLITHPESFIMVSNLAILISLWGLFKYEKGFYNLSYKNMIIVIFVLTTVYALYNIDTTVIARIFMMVLLGLSNIKRALSFILSSHGGNIKTAATIKPPYVKNYFVINSLVSIVLIIISLIVEIKSFGKSGKISKESIALSAFVFSSVMFLFLFSTSAGEFIGRSALAISVVVGIILSKYVDKVLSNLSRARLVILNLVITYLIVVAFIARTPAQEWNVDAYEYYPPLRFINSTGDLEHSYYIGYPNYNTLSTKDNATYLIVPVGQERYITALRRWFGMSENLTELYTEGNIIYNNKFTIIIVRGQGETPK